MKKFPQLQRFMQLIKNISAEKLRGGFYTPNEIASFILKWGIGNNSQMEILEPSCGDGVFLKELQKHKYNYKSITAVELDPNEAKKAKYLNLKNSEVIIEDFHKYFMDSSKKFDLIVGNPPYIRFQYFKKKQQALAFKIFEHVGLKYSKLSNSWVSFVIGSSLLLKEVGKLGFVLPAEILQVSYSKTLREFLGKFYNKITIISFEKLVFPNIQQEVVILLCEKNKSRNHFIEHIEVKDVSELKNINTVKLENPQKKIDFKSNKWTLYYLNQEEINFLKKLKDNKKIPSLRDYVNVEVGITTGANSFFTVPLSIVDKYDLHEFARPMVGRSVQVPGAIFNTTDWEDNKENNSRSHLLVFPKLVELQKFDGAKKYIEFGESENIHKGYKNRIREEWQIVPSLRVSDALFIRRNNLYPKLIVNNAKAYTTDTMHRVSMKDTSEIKAVVGSYYNSISLAFAELSGRSHGGGVLELMPSETEDILLPFHNNNSELVVTIDKMMRDGKSIEEILKITNLQTLKQNFGFNNKEINLADSIRKKLSKRRLNRGKK